MGAKTKSPQGKDEGPDKDVADTPDSPLLDLSDAAVRKMIKLAKKRGYVTYEQLNAVLPSEEVTSEQIEDILAMLNEMGINVVEQDDAEPEEQSEEPSKKPKRRNLTASSWRWSDRPPPRPKKPNQLSGLTIRFACICAKWAAWNCSRARARSPLPNVLRQGAKQ